MARRNEILSSLTAKLFGLMREKRIVFLTVLILAITFIALSSFSRSSKAAVNLWSSNGPYGGFGPYDGGFVYALASPAGPAYAQTIYAAVGNGFVFKTIDGGSSWEEFRNGFSNPNVHALAVSPNFANDKTIFAGTEGGLVFVSTDGGVHWDSTNTVLDKQDVSALAVSPNFANDKTIFAGTEGGGAFVSTDGGAHWSEVNLGLANLDVSALAISPNFTNDSAVFAGTAGGLFKSISAGNSWNLISSGLPGNAAISCIAPSPNFANDKTVFAGAYIDGVFKSVDDGNNWRAINCGLKKKEVWALAVSPNFANDNLVFAGLSDGWIYKSSDRGSLWNIVGGRSPSAWVYSLLVSPEFSNDRTIFAGTESGAYSYSFLSDDFTPPFAPLVSSPTHPDQKKWYSLNNASFKFTGRDAGSGVKGFSYGLDRNSSTLPGEILKEAQSTVSFNGLGDGVWYFHVRAIDGAGNWGYASHFVTKIDSFRPKATVAASSTHLRKCGLISFNLIEGMKINVRATVRIEKGRSVVKTFLNNKWLSAGSGKGIAHKIYWNGRDSGNRLVRKGTYAVSIYLTDPAGNLGVARRAIVVCN